MLCLPTKNCVEPQAKSVALATPLRASAATVDKRSVFIFIFSLFHIVCAQEIILDANANHLIDISLGAILLDLLVDLLVSHHRHRRHFIRDGKLTRRRGSVGRSREERERGGEEGLGHLRSPQVCSRFASCNGRSSASNNTSMFLTSHVVLTCTMPVSLSFPTVRFCSSGHCATHRTRRVSIPAAFRPEVWRGRRIAPTREGPRNESSNRAHGSTSGRSTHYASGHLIRVFRGIGHIFSSPYPFH